MITSRGCPFSCIYCSYPQTIYGHKHRANVGRRVIRESTIWSQTRRAGNRIDDDTFDINRQRVIEFANS